MLQVLAYNYGHAAGNVGTGQGPQALKKLPIWSELKHTWLDLEPSSTDQGQSALPQVAVLNERLAQAAKNAVIKSERFLTLGGDHSAGIGSWSGASCALAQPIGLLWVDAHLDSHTPETTPSNNIHGMPVAVLLGEGDARLCNIANHNSKINAENLCIFGARSYEPAELELLNKHGAHIITADEIKQRGFEACLSDAMTTITRNTAAIGLSIDVDGIDPEFAPAVGTPAANGLTPKQIFSIIEHCKQHNLLGLELCEFNPECDIEHRTEQLLQNIIQRFAS